MLINLPILLLYLILAELCLHWQVRETWLITSKAFQVSSLVIDCLDRYIHAIIMEAEILSVTTSVANCPDAGPVLLTDKQYVKCLLFLYSMHRAWWSINEWHHILWQFWYLHEIESAANKMTYWKEYIHISNNLPLSNAGVYPRLFCLLSVRISTWLKGALQKSQWLDK